VLFLELSSEEAAKRGGYGEERYETQKMQTRVRSLFHDLFQRLPNVNVRRIDAGGSIDRVSADIKQVLDEALTADLLSKPLGKFAFLTG
jgi:dTMP kinase